MTRSDLGGSTIRGLDTAERAREREQEDICRKCGAKKSQRMSDNEDSMEMVWKCSNPSCGEIKSPSGIF